MKKDLSQLTCIPLLTHQLLTVKSLLLAVFNNESRDVSERIKATSSSSPK